MSFREYVQMDEDLKLGTEVVNYVEHDLP